MSQLKIHLSTSTIHSYENRSKMMNLRFNPIVFFENSWPFPTDHLENIRWRIESEKIGMHDFEMGISVDSPLPVKNDRNYIEFHLSKINVPFQYDDYPCSIVFSAIINSPHTSPIKVDQTYFGVVKTKWSKGLR